MRFKRGVFNFTGGIGKILFGTVDSDDASYYTERISSLEREQLDFFRLSKEQVTVKSTLRSLNFSLFAMSENEIILSKGLDEVAKHVSEHDSEIKEMFSGICYLQLANTICSWRGPWVNVGESTIF
jgi:hypothetical protein